MRRRRRAPVSSPLAEPKRPSGSTVQTSSGALPGDGDGGVLRNFPKIVGTLVVSAAAVIVMVEVPVAPEVNATLAGAKAHDAPSGNPEQVRVIGPKKPLVEVNVSA